MEITGKFNLKGNQQEVWDVLNNPRVLEKAIPGADKLIPDGPDRYRAEMSVGVGMIRGRFSGSVVVEDKQEPEKYRMIVDGKGGPGWLQGNGMIELSTASDGTTDISVQGDASVGGLLARVGQRMVRNMANSLMKQFFKNIEKELIAARK